MEQQLTLLGLFDGTMAASPNNHCKFRLSQNLFNKIVEKINIYKYIHHNENFHRHSPYELANLARTGGNFDAFVFVTSPGAMGLSLGGKVCDSDNGGKITLIMGYGPFECNNYSPPQPVDCTRIHNRIVLTAEVIYDMIKSDRVF